MKRLLRYFHLLKEIEVTRSMQEFLPVAEKVYEFRNRRITDRLDRKLSEKMARQLMRLHVYAEEFAALRKCLTYNSTGVLAESFMSTRSVQAGDLHYLLPLCNYSGDKEVEKKLGEVVTNIIKRSDNSLDDLFFLASNIRQSDNRGKFGQAPLPVNALEKLADDLAAFVFFLDAKQEDEYYEILTDKYTPSILTVRMAMALIQNSRITSLVKALKIKQVLNNQSYDIRNSIKHFLDLLLSETISLSEKEAETREGALAALDLLSAESQASLFDNDTMRGLRNGVIEKALSVLQKSGCAPLDLLSLFASKADWPSETTLRSLLGAFLKTMRLTEVTVENAVFIASQFRSNNERFLFLRLYIEEIWRPNFDEALILWGSYRETKGFLKDDMDDIVFSALKRGGVEFGPDELMRAQVWSAGKGNQRTLRAVALQTRKFLEEVIQEEQKAFTA